MSTKKTIQINPELFKLSGGKTRKNRGKKELSLTPVVSPNNLKNKLLKRIKEHKTQEIKNNSQLVAIPSEKSYTDEFYGALDYLSDLTKKQKVTEAKQRILNTKTLKNYQPINSNLFNTNNQISLELPPELQDSKCFTPQIPEVFNVNYKLVDDIPYGCLKGGKKKTYREWKEAETPDITDIIRPPTPPKKNEGMYFMEEPSVINSNLNISANKSSREERLEQIKNKLKKLQDNEIVTKQQSLDNFKQLEKDISVPPIGSSLGELENSDSASNIEQMLDEREENKEKEKNKRFLKKTVKRKFTLGKSDKLRRVSVLIKDRQTRKNIINTQKELKKTTITDVKKYLRQHGIIKVGSTCPADILRKTFEAAVLTGEVTNINRDTLLHNFLSSDKEK